MSGYTCPWDTPFDVLINHNNGEDGLNAAGRKAYDKWQESLRGPLLDNDQLQKKGGDANDRH